MRTLTIVLITLVSSILAVGMYFVNESIAEKKELQRIKELNSERTITLPDPNSSEWRSIDDYM